MSDSSTSIAAFARSAATLGSHKYGGGTYIPPARFAMLQKEELSEAIRSGDSARTSDAFQRVSWEALKKSLNGLINKVIYFQSSHTL